MSDEYDSQFGTGNPQVAQESHVYSQALRHFLDRSAARVPDAELTADLIRELDRWSERLERSAGSVIVVDGALGAVVV